MNINKIRSLLDTNLIGNEIIYYEQTSSTNDTLFNLAKNSTNDGTVVIADSQTKGKGRLGRSWYSPKGKNLYFSFLIKPKITISQSPVCTFLASLALTKTILSYGITADVKWPNDILINKRKIAGVLTEMSSTNNRLDFIIIGIGINLNMTMKDIQNALPEVSKTTTSLMRETKDIVDREIFTARIINDLDYYYEILKNEGLNSIVALWTSKWSFLNREVKINLEGKILNGIARKVDTEGYFYIEKESGDLEKVIAGDMIVEN